MATVRVYFGIENLGLTNAQRNTLVAELQALGEANASVQPAERNHWRTRLDNQAVIFEALFNEDHLTIAATKARLAAIFGVSVAQVGHATLQTAYGLVVVYQYNSVNRLRSVAFGYEGGWPAWGGSNAAAISYLADNRAAWDGIV